jgi:hypothetical protein
MPTNVTLPVHRQWVQEQERQAAAAIARAVQRYRDAGVDESDLISVSLTVPPNTQQQHGHGHVHHNSNNNLTFRRICIAVAAVVTASMCIMLQTIPLLQSTSTVNPVFDQLLYELDRTRQTRSRNVSKYSTTGSTW